MARRWLTLKEGLEGRVTGEENEVIVGVGGLRKEETMKTMSSVLAVRVSGLTYKNSLGNPEQNEKLAKVSSC